MFYCDACMAEVENNPCPRCGKKRLPPAGPDDILFLANLDYIESGLFEGALQGEDIPYMALPTSGVSIMLNDSSLMQRRRFYVKAVDWPRSVEILHSMFGELS